MQEIAEVFGPHRWLEVVHVVSAHHLGEQRSRELGLGGMVDGRRVVAREGEIAAALEGGASGLGDRFHAPLDQVEHLGGEGAHRALDHARLGDHVGRLASVDHRHRDHAGVDRPLVAADDGLECLHHLARCRHRVDAVVRHRAVRALAADGDLEFIARCEHRARPQSELAHRHARPVVRAEDGLHRELIEQTVLHHLARTAAAFFGWLEHQVDGAIEGAVLRQVLGSRQQHRGVAVVSARVHLAGMGAGMREAVHFGHRQCIDVGAQAHRPFGSAVLDDADDAGLAHAAVDRDAPVGQRLGDEVRGALLLEAQLRVGMDVAAQRRDGGGIRQDGFDQAHGGSGCRGKRASVRRPQRALPPLGYPARGVRRARRRTR